MKKKIITISIIVAVVLLLGGLYLWYNGNYAGKKKVVLQELPSLSYDWQKVASDDGLVGDYLWQRSREYLVKECGENGLIPSYYIIPGRLTTQPGEASGVYRLEDQALLLKMYVKSGDRFEASSLKKSVEKNIDISGSDNSGKAAWLDACLYYYNAYGTKSDYVDIEKQVDNLFDDNGHFVPETLSAASYHEGAFASMEDTSDVKAEDVGGTLAGSIGESGDMFSFEGVQISSIDLRLVKNLEDSELIPSGSYEYNLGLVKGALVANNIPLYAFAYTEVNGEISYIYSHNVPASVDVEDSVRTMLNLARVNELPDDSYRWIQGSIFNNGSLRNTYYIVAGNVDGNEAFRAYTDIMEIAYLLDDTSLYGRICDIEGARVATYTNSPALSLIYREENGRYVLYAEENLAVSLLID
ncbi:MAG: hypothetical protein MJ093_03705 [Saccharofermentans sp.]|nr:hypothetical protein [Saccharofermentans sp.]